MNNKQKLVFLFLLFCFPQYFICHAQIIPPKVIYLNSRPAPQTIIIPFTPAQAQGKKCTYHWGRDTIEQTKEIVLTPLETIPLPVLKNKKGEVIKDKNGMPFILGENGGVSVMQTYTTDNGLALDVISYGHKSALCDSKGNLWFGTAGGGVSRYDGKSFSNFTTAEGLTNNFVASIIEDKNGNLWFGTNGGGVSRYDGKSFTNFTVLQGLANNFVASITEDKQGNIWFGTQGGGASRYDGKSFTNYATAQGLANNTVASIIQDKNGNLWFGTYGGGVSRYNGKSFTNYTTAQGLANNSVGSIAEDRNGNLWFGTAGGGISCYDGKVFINYTMENGLGNNSIKSITEDKNGNLWFGVYGKGVSRYDGKCFTNFTMTQGLANNFVASITEDKNGSIWFGTQGGGISRYDGKSFTNYTTAQGLGNNSVRSIMEDKSGNLWFGTQEAGVSRYDGKSFTNFTTAQGLANNAVLSIIQDKSGNLWFGTAGGGVSRYDGKSFTNFTTTQGLANNNVLSIIEDKNGNLWFGTYGGGVSCYDGKSFTNYTTAQGLTNNVVLSIIEDKGGNIWFGTSGGGLSRYDGNCKVVSIPNINSKKNENKYFINYSMVQGLANNTVINITEDKSGNLWFGTSGGGLSRLSSKKLAEINEKVDGENMKLFENYTKADGLPDDEVTQIVEYNDRLYIGTNHGISELIPSPSGKVRVGSVFNVSTGYPVKDVNAGQNAMYKDSKGIIWIATGADKTGLVRFDPSAVNANLNPPKVILQKLKVNEKILCWYDMQVGSNQLPMENKKQSNDSRPTDNKDIGDSIVAAQEIMTYGKILSNEVRDSIRKKFSGIQFEDIIRFYPLPEHLVLPYENNHITFEFCAIEPARPWLIKYQYILEGYDNEWSPETNKTDVSYGNIYEGTYTFKLKAQSPFGVWSEPITYTFKVQPPWWRTIYIYILYVLLIIAIVVLIVWWNVRRLRAKAKELEEEVKKATVTILKQKEDVEKSRDEIEKSKHIIEEKNKDITDSINYAKRIQKAMLPHLKDISTSFPQSFVLFKPKDIVSGDFYFFHKNENIVFIAAADCTGHGVPGAFMSLIGSDKLHDAVLESSDTSEILSLLNKGVKTALKQSETDDKSTRDGMDIALCSVDSVNRIVKYAGANRPMWIIRKGQIIIEEIKATKNAIGGFTEDSQHYDTHVLRLQQGDTFYISTDGYADTFGGNEGKKISTKKFKDILLSIQDKSLKEQEKHLDDFVENWKAGTEQVDDILVIGIRL